MSKTKPQPELTIKLNMDIKTDIVISGIKLKYLPEQNTEYCIHHFFQVFDELHLEHIFKLAE